MRFIVRLIISCVYLITNTKLVNYPLLKEVEVDGILDTYDYVTKYSKRINGFTELELRLFVRYVVMYTYFHSRLFGWKPAIYSQRLAQILFNQYIDPSRDLSDCDVYCVSLNASYLFAVSNSKERKIYFHSENKLLDFAYSSMVFTSWQKSREDFDINEYVMYI